MLKYADLKNRPKELLAATGLKQDEFEAVFGEAYRRIKPSKGNRDNAE